MGVKGLQHFAEVVCPGALVEVDIAHLAFNFYQHSGRKPVLIVDGMGCLRTFYKPHIPWVYGGQWLRLLEEIKCFINAFTRVGIDLVFIFDGVIESSKITEWVKRRLQNINDVAKIFRSIKRSSRHPEHNLYHIPPSLACFCVYALRYHGVTVYNSVIEADRAIFHYYKRFGAFGVLGQDSDFLVFDIQNYFSLNSLSFKRRLSIKMYDKARLCEELHLRPFHLPLLACLMGNDVIQHTKLSGFHSKVTDSTSKGSTNLLLGVASFLSGLQIDCLTPQVVGGLEKQVFDKDPQMYGMMDMVVRQYVMLAEPESQPQTEIGDFGPAQQKDHLKLDPSKSSKPFQSGAASVSEEHLTSQDVKVTQQTEVLEMIRRAHVKAEIKSDVLSVIIDHVYQSGTSIEDYTDSSMPTAGLVLKPIRQRMYGLLLGVGVQEDGLRTCVVPQTRVSSTSSSCPDSGGKNPSGSMETSSLLVGVNAIHEWVVYSEDNLTTEPEITEAKQLNMPGGTPRMESLWLRPNTEAWPLKFQSFLACMYYEMNPAQLHRIPVHFMLLCILLHYFHNQAEPSFLRESDVNAFLAQAVCLQMHTTRSLASLSVPRVEPRGVHLATLFMRGVSLATAINSACGLPLDMNNMMPWRFFDGKLFHVKYLMSQQGKPVQELCDGNALAIEDFHLMKTCIYSVAQVTGQQQ